MLLGASRASCWVICLASTVAKVMLKSLALLDSVVASEEWYVSGSHVADLVKGGAVFEV